MMPAWSSTYVSPGLVMWTDSGLAGMADIRVYIQCPVLWEMLTF